MRLTAAQAEQIPANFRDGERLMTAIPAKRTRKLVVFAWLAERLTVGRVYSELTASVSARRVVRPALVCQRHDVRVVARIPARRAAVHARRDEHAH